MAPLARDLVHRSIRAFLHESAQRDELLLRNLRRPTTRMPTRFEPTTLLEASNPPIEARHSNAELLGDLKIAPVSAPVRLHGTLAKINRYGLRHPVIRSHLHDRGDRIVL